MKQIDSAYIFEKWFKDIGEDITMDPTTLLNIIQDGSMVDSGFNWINGSKRNVTTKKIFDAAPKLSFMIGDFIRETLDEAEADTQSQYDAAVPEANSRDPRIMSTDPQFNACPAFLNTVCRVNGRPCTWSNFNKEGNQVAEYKQCSIYHLASGGDPQLFSIEVGSENSEYYAMGNRS
jgi:hypothetical protein